MSVTGRQSFIEDFDYHSRHVGWMWDVHAKQWRFYDKKYRLDVLPIPTDVFGQRDALFTFDDPRGAFGGGVSELTVGRLFDQVNSAWVKLIQIHPVKFLVWEPRQDFRFFSVVLVSTSKPANTGIEDAVEKCKQLFASGAIDQSAYRECLARAVVEDELNSHN